jgi:hypothetical protein
MILLDLRDTRLVRKLKDVAGNVVKPSYLIQDEMVSGFTATESRSYSHCF